MVSRHIETLLQRSKTTSHLIQLQSLVIKTALDNQDYFFSKFILVSSVISLQISREFFDKSSTRPSLFAWNTLIKGYSKGSTPSESVKLFIDLQRIGIKPDKYTFPFVLRACGRCSMVGVGGTLHSMVLKMGFYWDSHICNTLLRMYGGLGLSGYSRQVFDEIPKRDVVSWSSMVAAYVNCDRPIKAITAFRDMIRQHEKPNSITLVSLLAACTRLLNVKLGESIHSHILTSGIGLHVELGTALLDMYAKCGRMMEAFHIFYSLRERNLQSWTVMISGLADNSFGEEAIALFSKMEEAGLEPDSKSFSGVLSACSHMGLIDEGKYYFDKMLKVHHIRPTMEHYGCLVDMFGRAGKIEEAYQVIKSMPMEPNSIVLRSFISSCRNHGHIICEDKHLEQLLKIEPDTGANYVLAGSMCSLSGYWTDTNDLRVSMKQKGLNKVPGSSWVELV